MTKYLVSGMRRDIVALIYDLGQPREQAVKRALESHYDERITPREFRGAIEALVDHGFVQKTQDGVHDRLSLTDAGEQALHDHVEWLTGLVEDGTTD